MMGRIQMEQQTAILIVVDASPMIMPFWKAANVTRAMARIEKSVA
jgi:hypothetical protein